MITPKKLIKLSKPADMVTEGINKQKHELDKLKAKRMGEKTGGLFKGRYNK